MSDTPEQIEAQIETLREKRDEESLAKLARLHIARVDAHKRQFEASLRRRAALLKKKEQPK